MGVFEIIFIFGIIISMFSCVNADGTGSFNVMDFGALGDGKKDDNQAFLKAWDVMCKATEGAPSLVVPQGKTFLLSTVSFAGPCKASNLTFQIAGTIVAPDTPKAWDGKDPSIWIAFRNVNGITVNGGGTLNGNGKGWWDQSCRDHPNLKGCTKLAPTSLNFLTVNDGHLRDIHIIDSPQVHVLLLTVNGFEIYNLNVNSPELSPNTDGVHMQVAQHVTISNSEFRSGDDCVSIGDHCNDIKVHTCHCGPGHGVSIGSLGLSGNEVEVEDIHAENINFVGTTNGVRIKTYQAGRGYCRGVTFKSSNFTNVQNPIIIDQYYFSKSTGENTGVHISNVSYDGLKGTSDTARAITLNCSKVVGCDDLKFNQIQLTSVKAGTNLNSVCINAHGTTTGTIDPPLTCLLH